MKKLIILLLLLPTLALGAGAKKGGPAGVDTPTAEYSFYWDAENLTSAVDGASTNVPLLEGTTGQFVPGVEGNAYDTNGTLSTSRVSFVVTSSDLFSLEEFTIEFDFDVKEIVNGYRIFGFGDGDNNVELVVKATGEFTFQVERGGTTTTLDTATMFTDTTGWTHIKLVLTSAQDMEIYVNEEATPEASRAITNTFDITPDNTFYIGSGRGGINRSYTVYDNFYLYKTGE